MKRMEPMEPMKPMAGPKPWWPADLGEPSSSGSQNDLRYAFFPGIRRLLIELNGTLDTYDTGDHRISGVSQQDSQGQTLAFTSQEGLVRLDGLRQIR
ncbi:hypothetical protein [Lichenicola cladoniae]|nr:hypothetical protein [Lichenicola cladoniae]